MCSDMTTISRSTFTSTLAQGGGYIDVDHMSSALTQAFQQSNISKDDLLKLAGEDHVIRGSADFNSLFNRIDPNHGAGGIATTDRSGQQTAAGRMFSALETEVNANRSRIAREGGLRFDGDATLAQVSRGNAALTEGSRGDHVKKVQEALIDLGFDIPTHGASGTYDAETKLAVQRFQREVGLPTDGSIGGETLGALAATAPPPGQKLVRSAEYDRLFRDGRLDVTIALGFDEHGTEPDTERNVLSSLRAQGYNPIDPSTMTPADRTRLGLGTDRYDPNAQYFTKRFHDGPSNRDVDAVVRLITPGTDGAKARASFQQAMRQDEVVIYGGHARYGTGPDFDPINSGTGNFVIDPHGNRRGDPPPAGLRNALRGRSSDLPSLTSRPDYQVLIFNACTSENYLNNLRDRNVFHGDMGNTDVIATTMPTLLATNGQHVGRFLEGVTMRENNNSMLAAQNAIEQRQLKDFGMDSEVPQAGYTYTESGFLRNDANQRAPR
jgi:peptidoglycan hydrolase-like protein with peptidoglycan-binding domain